MGEVASWEKSLTLDVPMGHMAVLPLMCSLAAADAAGDALVRWPSGVVGADGEELARIRASVRYDGGLVADIAVSSAPPLDGAALERAFAARMDAWAAETKAGRAKAGPLAPVLPELFDRMWLMGERVSCLYPNGRAFAEGRLAALDVWGRVTVIDDAGVEIEFSPEQAGIAPATR